MPETIDIPIVNKDYYDTLKRLHTVVLNTMGKSVSGLEVGLGWGTSAQAYLSSFPNAELDSIEQADYHGIFDKMNRKYGERIRIIVGKTPEVYRTAQLLDYDFIYIDAAHDVNSVSADIIGTWIHLKPGGIIAFDDYGVEGLTEEGKPQGVKQAVDEFFERTPIFNERTIIAFRKE